MRSRISATVVLNVLIILFAFVYAPLARSEESVPGQQSPANSPGKPPATMEVSFNDGLLSVKAQGADLAALLGKIASAAGVEIEVGKGVTGSVSLTFEGLALEEGVKRALESADARNFLATFDKPAGAKEGYFSLKKISVVRKATGEAQPGAPPEVKASDFPRTIEGVKEYLKAKYGERVEIDFIQYDEKEDRIKRIAYYEPGISKRLNKDNIKQFREEKLREFTFFLELDMTQLRSTDLYLAADTIGFGGIQAINGVPVENSGAAVHVLTKPVGDGKADLVKIGATFYPDVNLPTEPKITREEAEEIAAKKFRSQFYPEKWAKLHDNEKAPYHPTTLLIRRQEITDYPGGPIKGYEYYLCWKIDYLTHDFYVDALTGRIIQGGRTTR